MNKEEQARLDAIERARPLNEHERYLNLSQAEKIAFHLDAGLTFEEIASRAIEFKIYHWRDSSKPAPRVDAGLIRLIWRKAWVDAWYKHLKPYEYTVKTTVTTVYSLV